ncbi:MAG: tetratricopeptide repeat protein [Rhizomicrobium sp.]
MADKSELQHIPRAVDALVLSETRSGLIARARRDAACLMECKPVNKDILAVRPLEASILSNSNDAEEQFQLGHTYYSKQAYQDAAFWFRRAADQGHAEAQLSLGFLYQIGRGVPQDYAMDAYWLRKAADQGHAMAQYGLGVLYLTGMGVSKDPVKATDCFREASMQGLAKAQFLLGYAYEKGEGVSQDYAKAAKWYRMAAEEGETEAQTRLGLLYGSGQGVQQSDPEA